MPASWPRRFRAGSFFPLATNRRDPDTACGGVYLRITERDSGVLKMLRDITCGLVCLGLAALTVGCGGGGTAIPGGTPPGDGPGQPADPPKSLVLANRCVALKAAGGFVTRAPDRGYVVDGVSEAAATGFYLKPAALGQYLIYADDQTLLAAAATLTAVAAPADRTGWQVDATSIWTIDASGGGISTVRSQPDGNAALGIGTGRALTVVQGGAPEAFEFIALDAARCAVFPEIRTDSVGETYTGRGVDHPVVGFADVHMHLSATDFLGGNHVGRPFSRFGVAVAMPDGASVHGPDGHLDLIGNLYGGDPLATHDTVGWPTFQDWPAWDMLTHEGAYYPWVARAYQAGLRLMVNNLVQNDALCQLQKLAINANPNALPDLLQNVGGAVTGLISDGCSDLRAIDEQAQFMHDLQDYIDAQAGGPGLGWFRIVTTPEQARQVINDGKLAVVLGVEVSNVFGCRVTILAAAGQSTDIPRCDAAQIDAQLRHLYDDLGVRQINLVHEFNNALGGNGIFNDFIINVGNFYDTGSFWQTENCPTTDTSGRYADYYYTPGTILKSVNPLANVPDNPLSGLLNAPSGLLDLLTQGTLPSYPTDARQCNRRAITELGRYALQAVMKRRMMIDVDHMSVRMKGQVIEAASQQTPVYPVISSHGGHGGITLEQARQIMALGGLIHPIDATASRFVSALEHLRGILPPGRVLALSNSSDINGMAAQPEPEKAATRVAYPFTLFQGAAWSDPMFAGIQPVTFSASRVPQGRRVFDFNTEGVAHYGLYADWVEAVRIAGGASALNALYRSAEAYLQTWEAVRRR